MINNYLILIFLYTQFLSLQTLHPYLCLLTLLPIPIIPLIDFNGIINMLSVSEIRQGLSDKNSNNCF